VTGSDKAAFFQNIAEHGADPLELFTTAVNSKAFQVDMADPLSVSLSFCVSLPLLFSFPLPFPLLSVCCNLTPADSFQAIKANTEIQHRIMEAHPLLEAFEGFKDLIQHGRRLSAEEVGSS
jgi:hypothetical protein